MLSATTLNGTLPIYVVLIFLCSFIFVHISTGKSLLFKVLINLMFIVSGSECKFNLFNPRIFKKKLKKKFHEAFVRHFYSDSF